MSSDLLPVAIQILALLFAVSFHESAHGWVAWKCGDPTAKDLGRITLNPLRHIDPVGSVLLPALLAFSGAPVFGWAKPVPVAILRTRNPRTANLLVSAAGPISNLLLAALFAIAVFVLKPSDAPGAPPIGPVSYILFYLAFYSVLINVVLALFNLLPIPPLDGFGVVESLVPRSFAPAVYWMRRFGMILLVVVIFSGALQWMLGPALHAVSGWLLGAR